MRGSTAAPAMRPVGRSWVLLTGFVLFYIVYLMFGAVVFSSIERPVEEQLRRDVEALKQEFLNRSCVHGAALEAFLSKVLRANKYGVSVLRNASSASNWDLVSSMFFANSLVTTVGYGHATPLSDTGKAFSILYAIIGVPFTMLVLTACVQRLLVPLVLAPIGLLQRCGLGPRPAVVVHFVVLLVLVLLGFFVVPAAVFSVLEVSWSFLDGIYFCFISLFTVGLGDFVPGTQPQQKNKALYQVSVIVYLFVGMLMMILLLRTFHKMADLHGVTSLLQLPRCEESDLEDDREPIIEEDSDVHVDRTQPSQGAKGDGGNSSSTPLEPGAQQSYNTINKG